MIFSEHTLDLLRHSGWHEHYTYDTQSYEKMYETAGCPPPTTVLEFMRRFGGLQIHNPNASPPGPSEFDFNVPSGVRNEFYEFMISHLCSEYDELCKLLGIETSPMYCIGSLEHEAELLMTVEGKIYAYLDDDMLLYVGDNGDHAIESLCSGRRLPFVPVP